jgi:hypothetical protein
MGKITIEKIVLVATKQEPITVADLKELLVSYQDTDTVKIEFIPENQGDYDIEGDHYMIQISRKEEESDEDYNERMTAIERRKDTYKRYKERLFNRLKEEFEPKTTGL